MSWPSSAGNSSALSADVPRSAAQPGAVFSQGQGFPGVGAERGVAAQEAGCEEQAPQGIDLRSAAMLEVAEKQADDERAGDIDDECAIREVHTPLIG
jgi:hypothetical protein